MLMFSYDSLAPLDAILNATAAILLLAGYIAIRRHQEQIHRAGMISAFTVSVAFFFSILTSRIILAVVIVPLALITLGRALRGRFARHRRIARWTWPIWMYVSVTGVGVYLMVYWLYPHLPPTATAAARDTRAAAGAAER